ncbi:MAG: hypothetical protein J0G32_02835 [Alphaproteobacteria bacterium]|nr:hypothetical protein [Alphaproteobacteria bacterium]OJV12108.1 MAG: hypothetical protein BGO27_05145 [Alphaproteobacteria bacterium 33-17]
MSKETTKTFDFKIVYSKLLEAVKSGKSESVDKILAKASKINFDQAQDLLTENICEPYRIACTTGFTATINILNKYLSIPKEKYVRTIFMTEFFYKLSKAGKSWYSIKYYESQSSAIQDAMRKYDDYSFFLSICLGGDLRYVKKAFKLHTKTEKSSILSFKNEETSIFEYTCYHGLLDIAQYLYELIPNKLYVQQILPGIIVSAYKNGHFEMAIWLLNISKNRETLFNQHAIKLVKSALFYDRLDVIDWMINEVYLYPALLNSLYLDGLEKLMLASDISGNLMHMYYLYNLAPEVIDEDTVSCSNNINWLKFIIKYEDRTKTSIIDIAQNFYDNDKSLSDLASFLILFKKESSFRNSLPDEVHLKLAAFIDNSFADAFKSSILQPAKTRY